jgi:transglutaminase-like putative cysteine protease
MDIDLPGEGIMSATDRARRRRSQRGSLLVSIAVLAAIGIPLGGLAPLLQGTDWWLVAMAFAALSVGASWAVRACGLRPVLGILAGLVAWFVASEWAFAPGTAILGIIPSPETIDTLASGFLDAGNQIRVQTIPADPVTSIVQLVAMACGLTAVLADAAVVTRFPALVGAVALALFLLVLWLAGRVGRAAHPESPTRAGRAPAAALALGSAAIACALVIPNITPGLTAEAFTASRAAGRVPSVYGAGIDPVIQLGRDLRRPSPILSLSYTTTAEKAVYLKMVDLSDFSTGVWQPDQPSAGSLETVETLSEPAGLAPGVARTTVRTDVSIEGLRSEWLPLPYPATSLSAARTRWTADPDTGVVTMRESNVDDYSAESLVLAPSAEQLAQAGTTVPASLQSQLELPTDLPDVVAETARQVTAGSTTGYDRAVALQSYFTSGEFTYSVDAPVDGDFDGSNSEALASFLEVKSGYCVHFASTMATMARVVGIPSRIAIGYFPNSAASSYVDGEPRYDVLTDQLHSWPELYFEGVGWLPFEPTPSLGITVPAYSLPNYAEKTAAAPSTAPGPTRSAATAKPTDAADPERTVPTSTAASSLRLRGWLTAGGVLAAVIIVGLVPAAIRRWRRRRRLRRIATAVHPATEAWRELRDIARDYGIDVLPGDTPAVFAARINALRRIAHHDVDVLRSAVEREQYGGGRARVADAERARIRASLEAVESSIAAEAEQGARRRAVLFPASLLVRGQRS